MRHRGPFPCAILVSWVVLLALVGVGAAPWPHNTVAVLGGGTGHSQADPVEESESDPLIAAGRIWREDVQVTDRLAPPPPTDPGVMIP